MANTLTIDQVSTVLNAIVAQATGNAAIATADTKDFVTVAQTGLLAGYDPLIGAISQVLSRTIFSVRPYTRKFKSLEADSITYGNHVRKLNIADKAAQNDGRLPLTDGVAVDQQQVSKPTILQTNFYGAQTYERQYTIFKDQLDTAFSSPEEFARFISMVVQNVSDMIEQDHEQFARLTVANYIGGVIAGPNAANQVVHLLTEYNTATGLSLTATTVLQPANYPGFIKWAFARIAALSALLTERSEVFHTNVTGKPIQRHTPESEQRIYLYAPSKFGIESRVLADTYHDNYLSMAQHEAVNFWQAIKTPDTINVKPTFMKADGTLQTPTNAVVQANVFGVIFDREAMGYTTVNQWSSPAPFNAKGGYTNVFFHFTDRHWNDFTENGIVLLMD
ncbi:MAG: hypothetical protein IIW53_02440 [Rikenellaceae bacterium]|nr:hypothetical protein [Rikenellaceae bacterium]